MTGFYIVYRLFSQWIVPAAFRRGDVGERKCDCTSGLAAVEANDFNEHTLPE